MEINKELLDNLFEQAKENPRLRQNLDLRTSSADTSQRMLNALLPGTVVPIHRHEDTTETVVCLCGKLDEVIYEEVVSYKKLLLKISNRQWMLMILLVRLSSEKCSASTYALLKQNMDVRYRKVLGIQWKL